MFFLLSNCAVGRWSQEPIGPWCAVPESGLGYSRSPWVREHLKTKVNIYNYNSCKHCDGICRRHSLLISIVLFVLFHCLTWCTRSLGRGYHSMGRGPRSFSTTWNMHDCCSLRQFKDPHSSHGKRANMHCTFNVDALWSFSIRLGEKVEISLFTIFAKLNLNTFHSHFSERLMQCEGRGRISWLSYPQPSSSSYLLVQSAMFSFFRSYRYVSPPLALMVALSDFYHTFYWSFLILFSIHSYRVRAHYWYLSLTLLPHQHLISYFFAAIFSGFLSILLHWKTTQFEAIIRWNRTQEWRWLTRRGREKQRLGTLDFSDGRFHEKNIQY